MSENKFKKFLFPTDEEYVPDISSSTPFSKIQIAEPSTTAVKRDIFGQIVQPTQDEEEIKYTRKDSLRTNENKNGNTTLVFNPTCYEDTKDIAIEILEKNTVIVNLESILKDETRRKDATRIIDYLCGVAFALQIEVEKINATTFLFK